MTTDANDNPISGSTGRTQLKHVIQPVGDIAAAVEFYSDVFGLATNFVDGDRFAALNAGGAVLALAAGAEDTVGQSAPSFKVSDLDQFLIALKGAGGGVVRAPEEGPHERRVVITDPWGNLVVVYASH